MTFSVGERPESGQDLINRSLGEGVSEGLQKSLANYQQQKKSRAALSGLKPLFKQAGLDFSPEEEEQFISSGIDPNIAASFAANIYKQKEASKASNQAAQAKTQEALMKQQAAEQEKEQEYEGFQNAFDSLDDLLPYAGQLWGKSLGAGDSFPINRKAIEKREQFDKLGIWLTDKVYTHFNKGTMSDAKLELIKEEMAPRVKLSERANRGRINALKTIANLPSDISKSELNKVINDQLKEVRKIPEGVPSKEAKEKYPEGTIIENDAGEELIRKGGKWQPVR